MPGNLELFSCTVVEMIRLQFPVGKKDYSSPMLSIERLGKLYLLRSKRRQLRQQNERLETFREHSARAIRSATVSTRLDKYMAALSGLAGLADGVSELAERDTCSELSRQV